MGGGEERGINKQEVTELRGTGGQFSGTQRRQSRGHWPFPPFLSLCSPSLSSLTPSYALVPTHFVFYSLPTSLVSHVHHSIDFLSQLFSACTLKLKFIAFFPSFQTQVLWSKTFFFPFALTQPLCLPLTRPFAPLILHFLCHAVPMWVQWIAKRGAAVLLTKHKAFYIHSAPGIPG